MDVSSCVAEPPVLSPVVYGIVRLFTLRVIYYLSLVVQGHSVQRFRESRILGKSDGEDIPRAGIRILPANRQLLLGKKVLTK